MNTQLNITFYMFLVLSLFTNNLFANESCLAPKSWLNNEALILEKNLDDLEYSIVRKLSLLPYDEHSKQKYQKLISSNKEFRIKIWGIPPLINFGGSEFKTCFIRVGSFIIIDEAYRLSLSNELRAYKDNIIFIKGLSKSELGTDVLRDSTLSSIISMLNMDLKNKVWIDLGAGSGILSIIAVKLGAKTTVLIEKYETHATEINLQINNIKNDNNCVFLSEDLIKSENIVSKIKDHIQGEKVIVGMNVGYWMDYSITNITGIVILKEMIKENQGFNIEKVMLGGHNPKIVPYFSSRWISNEAEQSFIRGLGFNPATKCLNIRFMKSDSYFYEDESETVLFTGNKEGDNELESLTSNPLNREKILMRVLGFEELENSTVSLKNINRIRDSEAVTVTYRLNTSDSKLFPKIDKTTAVSA